LPKSDQIEDARQRALTARRALLVCPHRGTETLCSCAFNAYTTSVDWARMSRQKVRR